MSRVDEFGRWMVFSCVLLLGLIIGGWMGDLCHTTVRRIDALELEVAQMRAEQAKAHQILFGSVR